jgi:hypothetical protein
MPKEQGNSFEELYGRTGDAVTEVCVAGSTPISVTVMLIKGILVKVGPHGANDLLRYWVHGFGDMQSQLEPESWNILIACYSFFNEYNLERLGYLRAKGRKRTKKENQDFASLERYYGSEVSDASPPSHVPTGVGFGIVGERHSFERHPES